LSLRSRKRSTSRSTAFPSTRFAGDLKSGKSGDMKLVMNPKERFGVELPDEAIDRFGAVGDMARHMSRFSSQNWNSAKAA
jgi:hypothetical protein